MDFNIPNGLAELEQDNEMDVNIEYPNSAELDTDLERDLTKISKAFPTVDLEFIKSLLFLYQEINEQERIKYVCSDLIKRLEDSKDVDQLIIDAKIIRELFPNVNGSIILSKLKETTNQLGRIHAVIKDITLMETKISSSNNNCIQADIFEKSVSSKDVACDKNMDVPSTSTDYSINVPLSHLVNGSKLYFNPPIKNCHLFENKSEIMSEENVPNFDLHNDEDVNENLLMNYDIHFANLDTTSKTIEQDSLNLKLNGSVEEFKPAQEVLHEEYIPHEQDIVHIGYPGPNHKVPLKVKRDVKKRKSNLPSTYKKRKSSHNNNLDTLINVMDAEMPSLSNICNEGILMGEEIIDLVGEDQDNASCVHNSAEPTSSNGTSKLYYQLLEMFAEVDHAFLRNICQKYKNNPNAIGSAIDEILATPDYPKHSKTPEPEAPCDPDVYLERLKQFLPEADPTYLMEAVERIKHQQDLEIFVMNSLETRNYPTMKDYLRKQKLAAQAKQYTTEFNVEQFLDVIPDPVNYFKSPDLKQLIITKHDKTYYQINNFLKNQFSIVTIKTITNVLNNSTTFFDAVNSLEKCTERMTVRRKTKYPIAELFNIPLLQAFAFVEHKQEILDVISYKDDLKEHNRTMAKNNGTMLTCSCCYDDEVLLEDSVNCPNTCVFCKECLTRCVEIGFGEGKYDYLCLANCGAQFTLQALKNSLPPKLFSKLAQKKQLEEIKAAGLEEIEFCPFCDFGTIPIPGDKLFRCLNPECMKESCRQCKETSHIPLTCEEVEKDDDVKKRTYVENKMTEALLRTCYKCGVKFIKQDGCNKMTCPRCGSTMCYVCNRPVTNYKHFNGQGGDKLNLCPLYSDVLEMHKQEVLKVAEEAKKEIGASDMKIDPQRDVAQHYDELKKRIPHVVPPGMAAVNINQVLARIQFPLP